MLIHSKKSIFMLDIYFELLVLYDDLELVGLVGRVYFLKSTDFDIDFINDTNFPFFCIT